MIRKHCFALYLLLPWAGAIPAAEIISLPKTKVLDWQGDLADKMACLIEACERQQAAARFGDAAAAVLPEFAAAHA